MAHQKCLFECLNPQISSLTSHLNTIWLRGRWKQRKPGRVDGRSLNIQTPLWKSTEPHSNLFLRCRCRAYCGSYQNENGRTISKGVWWKSWSMRPWMYKMLPDCPLILISVWLQKGDADQWNKPTNPTKIFLCWHPHCKQVQKSCFLVKIIYFSMWEGFPPPPYDTCQLGSLSALVSSAKREVTKLSTVAVEPADTFQPT